MTKEPKINKLYSVRDMSAVSGISEAMIKKLIFNKEIEYVKVGTKNFIAENVILAYIERNTVKVEQ